MSTEADSKDIDTVESRLAALELSMRALLELLDTAATAFAQVGEEGEHQHATLGIGSQQRLRKLRSGALAR